MATRRDVKEHEEQQALDRSSPGGKIDYKSVMHEADEELNRSSAAHLPDRVWRPLISKLGYSEAIQSPHFRASPIENFYAASFHIDPRRSSPLRISDLFVGFTLFLRRAMRFVIRGAACARVVSARSV
jgi:hypothetical protein